MSSFKAVADQQSGSWLWSGNILEPTVNFYSKTVGLCHISQFVNMAYQYLCVSLYVHWLQLPLLKFFNFFNTRCIYLRFILFLFLANEISKLKKEKKTKKTKKRTQWNFWRFSGYSIYFGKLMYLFVFSFHSFPLSSEWDW